jgi:ubiquinone/menaquinone biosynthesis C-methylase UbiE
MTEASVKARAGSALRHAIEANTYNWDDPDRQAITRRYDRLANILPVFDWIFFQPPSFRARAAAQLGLKPGDRVLEIGCGTGRNLPHLQRAVGSEGHIIGLDLSPGMLSKAHELCDRNKWDNVQLVECDAAEYTASEPFNGVMFGLSYNTIPHHLNVLHRAWSQLRPGGRLVIMDAKLPPGLGGQLVLPFSLWLMKHTVLSNPLVQPWEDLKQLAGTCDMKEFMFGSWYICSATKP